MFAVVDLEHEAQKACAGAGSFEDTTDFRRLLLLYLFESLRERSMKCDKVYLSLHNKKRSGCFARASSRRSLNKDYLEARSFTNEKVQ